MQCPPPQPGFPVWCPLPSTCLCDLCYASPSRELFSARHDRGGMKIERQDGGQVLVLSSCYAFSPLLVRALGVVFAEPLPPTLWAGLTPLLHFSN